MKLKNKISQFFLGLLCAATLSIPISAVAQPYALGCDYQAGDLPVYADNATPAPGQNQVFAYFNGTELVYSAVTAPGASEPMGVLPDVQPGTYDFYFFTFEAALFPGTPALPEFTSYMTIADLEAYLGGLTPPQTLTYCAYEAKVCPIINDICTVPANQSIYTGICLPETYNGDISMNLSDPGSFPIGLDDNQTPGTDDDVTYNQTYIVVDNAGIIAGVSNTATYDVALNGTLNGGGSPYAVYAVNYSNFPGEPYTDTDLDGVYSLGEPFIDINGDAIYNAPSTGIPAIAIGSAFSLLQFAEVADVNNCLSISNINYSICINDCPRFLDDHVVYMCEDRLADALYSYEDEIGALGGNWYTSSGMPIDPTSVNPHGNNSDPLAPYVYLYEYISPATCCRDTATLSYNFYVLPTATISGGDLSLCPGETASLTVTNTSAEPVTVFLSNGFSTGIIAPGATFTTPAFGPGVYTINQVVGINCDNTGVGSATNNLISCGTTAAVGGVNSIVWYDTDNDGVYEPTAEPFTDTNGDGNWDPGEPFTDVDGDGNYDAGEITIPGVQVLIYSNAGPDGIPGNADDNEPIGITYTNSAGQWSFAGLPVYDVNGNPIIYSITFPTQVIIPGTGGSIGGITFPNANGGLGIPGDSDAQSGGGTATFTLDGATIGDISAGYYFDSQTSVAIGYTTVNANASCSKTTINWTVANDLNVVNYEIERSVDGTNWNIVGSIPSSPSASSHSYSFNDNYVANNLTYYRVSGIEADGGKSVSTITSTKSNCADAIQLVSVYPNPVNGNTMLNYTISSTFNTNVTIEVVDMLGRVHAAYNVNIAAGTNNFTVNTDNLAQAVYFIGVKNSGLSQYVKFSKID